MKATQLLEMYEEMAFLHEDEEAGVFHDSDGFIVSPVDVTTPEAVEAKLQEHLQPVLSIAETKSLSRTSSAILRSVRSRVKSARAGGIRKNDLEKLNSTIDQEMLNETKDT